MDERDRRFLYLMATLVRSSHFWQLTRRDAEIAKSLNADYLSQLFILGSARNLDSDFVQVREQTGRGRAWCRSLGERGAGAGNGMALTRGQGVEAVHGAGNGTRGRSWVCRRRDQSQGQHGAPGTVCSITASQLPRAA